MILTIARRWISEWLAIPSHGSWLHFRCIKIICFVPAWILLNWERTENLVVFLEKKWNQMDMVLWSLFIVIIAAQQLTPSKCSREGTLAAPNKDEEITLMWHRNFPRTLFVMTRKVENFYLFFFFFFFFLILKIAPVRLGRLENIVLLFVIFFLRIY
jgi:hypothetical protein